MAAARIAGGLARALGGRVVITHTLKDLRATIAYLGARSTAPPLTGQPDAREAEAVRIVEEALAAAGDGATGVVEPGAPWDALQVVADREGARMLAVAARGQSAARGRCSARLRPAWPRRRPGPSSSCPSRRRAPHPRCPVRGLLPVDEPVGAFVGSLMPSHQPRG